MTPDDIGICLPVTWRRRSALAHGVVVSARSTVLPASGVHPELTLRCVPVDTDLGTWRAEAIGELADRLVDFDVEDDDAFELLGRTVAYHRFAHRLGSCRRAERPVGVAGRRARGDPHLLGGTRGLPRLLRRLRGDRGDRDHRPAGGVRIRRVAATPGSGRRGAGRW